MQLAALRVTRFKLLGQKEDLDTSITHITEAILFPSLFPHDPWFLLVVSMLFLLAQTLVLRYSVSRQPEDVKSSLEYFHYLRDNFYPLEAFQIPRDRFTSSFVEALAHHVMLRTGDETHNMEEMADLLREFGASDFSKGFPSVAVHAFSAAINSIYVWSDSKQPPEQVIEVLREVMIHNPDLDQVFLALVVCLANRFCMAHATSDYDEAISIVDKFFASHPFGDSLTPTQEKAITLIIRLIDARLTRCAKPEYLEDAIRRLRALLIMPSLPDCDRTAITSSLDRCVQQRFDYFGVTGNSVEKLSDNPDVVPGSSSSPVLAAHQPTVGLAKCHCADAREGETSYGTFHRDSQ